MEKDEVKPRMSFSETFRAFEKSLGFKNELKWDNIILIFLYHVIGVYWSYHYAFPVKWQTLVFATIMYVASGFGVTGGAHRLWTHKAYKVNLPLKLFMLMLYSTAGQNSLTQWVRDHRVHHKFSDTEADPHNANRGLFFSHIGWLMMKKNEEVKRRGNQIDMSDIENDPVLRFYNRYFNYFKLAFCYVLPTMIGIWLWGEEWKCAVSWQCFIRYLTVFHSELTVNSLAHTFGYKPYNKYAICKSICSAVIAKFFGLGFLVKECFIRYLTVFHSELTVNSLAHTFGYKPYNKNLMPAENRFVSTCSLGEGWHNYHHAFPFDYKAAEHFDIFNFGARFIRFFGKMGWAYDLREATPDMINSIAERLGDGTPVRFPLPTKNNANRATG